MPMKVFWGKIGSVFIEIRGVCVKPPNTQCMLCILRIMHQLKGCHSMSWILGNEKPEGVGENIVLRWSQRET